MRPCARTSGQQITKSRSSRGKAVNSASVQRESMFLSGETCRTVTLVSGQRAWEHAPEAAGVSRSHSTVTVRREGPNIKGLGKSSWHGLNQESRNGWRTTHRRAKARVKPERTRAVLSSAWG